MLKRAVCEGFGEFQTVKRAREAKKTNEKRH
jgi:hypothetical protein